MHFTLLLYYISIDPYICFGFCKNRYQGLQNYIHSTSNVIYALIVVNNKGRNDIGCRMYVVLNPPDDGFCKNRNICRSLLKYNKVVK
jgi:hypothetical protein